MKNKWTPPPYQCISVLVSMGGLTQVAAYTHGKTPDEAVDATPEAIRKAWAKANGASYKPRAMRKRGGC